MGTIFGKLLCWQRTAGVLGFAALLALGVLPGNAQAAPLAQSMVQRATAVTGQLLPADYHYLGLEPTFRDGTIILTLALEPADDMDLRGAINFIVLDEDGLRRVLAGADPQELDLAASAPLQFDPLGNKYQAIFNASGRNSYTVIVFNTGGKAGGYTLTALNGVLVDDAGQITVATPVAAGGAGAGALLTTTATPTETMAARVSATEGSPLSVSATSGPMTPPAPSVTALRISGALNDLIYRHFLAVQPAVRDGIVNLDMKYEPQGEEMEGKVNFLVLDEDGMRRFIHGGEIEEQGLAIGLPIPFNPNRNELAATFNASGSNEYTVVPYNYAPISATYTLSADGGLLVDRYGQSNEARAALAEYMALSVAQPAPVAQALVADEPTAAPLAATAAVTSAAPNYTSTLALTIPGADGDTSLTLVGTAAAAADRITVVGGQLRGPFAHNYWGLTPTQRDGFVVLTMDYIPSDNNLLRDNINFWVVDADGMRRIMAGSRPEDVAIGSGAVVQFGPDKGKLQGAFHASGTGEYAVIVYNATPILASYTLRTDGAELLAPSPDSALLAALP